MRHLVIGLGSIGRRHAQILLQYGHKVAGVDVCQGDAVPFPVYKSMREGWDIEPDMVWICTPTHLHARQAVEAIKRGVHVFIEKPVAHDLESALAIRDAWNAMEEKRMVWVACNMRFHPAVSQLKKALSEGLIGTPLIYRYHFSHYLPNMRPGRDYRTIYAARAGQGGGIILDDIHDIDLALWLGGAVEKQTGWAYHSGTLDIAAEDVACLCLRHKNKSVSILHMDFLRRDKSRGIEVIGEKGTLEWRSYGKNPERAILRWFKPGEAVVLWQVQISDSGNMFALQLEKILDCVEKPESSIARLEEATKALKIALEIRESNDCAY